MTRFCLLDDEIIHSSWGRENVDLWESVRFMVAERFRSPERTCTGDQTISAEVAVLTLTEPRPSVVGQPPLTSLAWMPGFEPIVRRGARDDGQGSSRGQPVWTSGALFCGRRHGQVASRPRGEPGGGRQAAITARFTSVFMTGASRLFSSTRCGRFAEAPTASTPRSAGRSRACGSAFLKSLEDLLVPRLSTRGR